MLTFMLAPNTSVKIEKSSVTISVGVYICKIEFYSKEKFEIFVRDTFYSKRYGVQKSTVAICVKSYGMKIKSVITVSEGTYEYSCN